MKRHRTHQIDELAQQILRAALPPTWVLNKHEIDYAKDYLVEIGDEDGNLTGLSFYIQLKGQAKASIGAGGTQVRFSLESKYAKYYVDKIRDLPVFLVVVDVDRGKGWWLFLQPVLQADQGWRTKKSTTVRIPTANCISDTPSLLNAADEAKRWIRSNHPASIRDAVIAQERRILDLDARFDVDISVVRDLPRITLRPKEEVRLEFKISGDREEVNRKLSDLLDKGVLVTFEPGEIEITGSRLFEQVEQEGCSIHAEVRVSATLTLICHDKDGRELARLGDVQGQVSGGRKELHFVGGLENSPLSLKIGPLTTSEGGTIRMCVDVRRWEGQPLRYLAYFDQLSEFFQALRESGWTVIECQRNGNQLFSGGLSLQTQVFVLPLARLFGMLSRARRIASRLEANPILQIGTIDPGVPETVDSLHAILFENGWSRPDPNVRVTVELIPGSQNSNAIEQARRTPGTVRLTSECSCEFFGEVIKVGRLVQEYTHMSVESTADSACLDQENSKENCTAEGDIRITLAGSEDTVLRVFLDESNGL